MDASRIELHTTAVASARRGHVRAARRRRGRRPLNPSGRGEADGGRPLPLAAAAGVRVLAISHTLLPTGVGNGFGRVAKEGDKTIPVGSLQFF